MPTTCLSALMISIGLLIVAAGEVPGTSAADEISPDCDINKGPCSRKLSGREIILDVDPKPVKSMQELTVTVVVRGGNESEIISADFGMPGMYMGRNRVTLRKDRDGRYTGKAVIPICPRGGRLWKVSLDIPAAGKVDFFFDVY